MLKSDLRPAVQSSAFSSKFFFLTFCFSFLVLLTSCGQRKGGMANAPLEVKDSHFIINGVDWKEVSSLPATGTIRQNTRAVGNLSIFKSAGYVTRCTAFLVTPDIIMTNYHCVSNSSQAQGAYIEFKHEYGVSSKNRGRFYCQNFVDGNQTLDMALLRCQGRPGSIYGVLKLETRPVQQLRLREKIYVIHQNCNHEVSPSCDPNKKYSPGMITKLPSLYQPQVQFDADTLQGSSGSPVFLQSNHAVVALNNVGLYNLGRSGNMIGEANGGVAMSVIVKYLNGKFPSLFGKSTPIITFKRRN